MENKTIPSYKAIMSHDIDFVTKFKNFRNVLGATKRNRQFFKNCRTYYKVRGNRKNDPYWSMEEMLEENNKVGIETHFYFMSGKSNPEYDLNDYNIADQDIKNLMISLNNNGAKIGLHPSYNSFNNLSIIEREKKLLEDALGKEVILSRQHYLRYEDPLTFSLLAKVGIKQDSSIGYRNKIGLKTMSSKPYIIYKDEEFELFEQPFVFMDTHLIKDKEGAIGKLNHSIKNIKKEEGVAMLIWHNNNYETDEQKEMYKNVLQLLIG